MMQGTLIVMEGIDGSGKSTQFRRLCRRLNDEGVDYRRVSFPRYDQDSSALIRAYLAGEYGVRPGDVNPYAASTFYAVDRFASFRTDWGAYYEEGGLILCDRYTTSNACHQGGKLSGGERDRYLDWLKELEYELMGLPAPKLVLYLDVELDVARRQLSRRQKDTDVGADIHERDFTYLADCLEAGRYAAAYYGWTRIFCVKNGEMRPVEEIHGDIFRAVSEILY